MAKVEEYAPGGSGMSEAAAVIVAWTGSIY